MEAFKGEKYKERKDGEMVPTDEWKDYQKNTRLEIKMREAYLPISPKIDSLSYDMNKDYVGRDKEDNLKKIKVFIKKFKEKYYNKNLYFVGDTNTQKTTLLTYMGAILINKKIKIAYTTYEELAQIITRAESFSDTENKETLKKLQSMEILLIDEINADVVDTRSTEWAIKGFLPFISKRFHSGVSSTIFCGQVSPSYFSPTVGGFLQRNLFDILEFYDSLDSVSTEQLMEQLNGVWDYDE